MNKVVHAACHGQPRGRCRVRRRAEDAIRAGTAIRVRRMVAVRALASAGPVRVAAARVGLNAALIGSAWLLAMTAAFSAWRCERGRPPVTAEQGLEPEAARRLKPGA